MEKWKIIEEFPNYAISNMGRVKRIKKNNKLLCLSKKKSGYIYTCLFKNGHRSYKRIHRLVLENFRPIDNMNNLEVNHKDGTKTNNKLENLEWCTRSENEKHAYKIGLKNKTGENHNQSKLTNSDIIRIKDLLLNQYENGLITQRKIANIFNVVPSLISQIYRGMRWNYIGMNNFKYNHSTRGIKNHENKSC